MMILQLTRINHIVFCLIVTGGFFLVGDKSLADELADILKQPILKPEQATRQHRKFITSRIPELTLPASANDWQEQASRLRKKIRQQVVFRGVPKSWYEKKPQVVFSDVIETGKGYIIRKLRYEALPDLWIPALLYEPNEMKGNVPVVLNVNGHDRKDGKAVRYKQLRCINLAKRGMLALNPEWIGMGQLNSPDFAHNHLAKLDLCGHSGLSVFFLAMSRGLDVLLDHKHADAERVAVTGLSGGGWQTIILSSLDERVTVCVPVAGYSSLLQRVVNRSSIGDLEQNPNDLVGIADYSHLTAMMVPRPTLLIYNDKDNCCFVSSTVKPNTYDPVVPFFKQAGVQNVFEYHENTDPGTHNYELDNRQQLYRFLNQHFLGIAPATNNGQAWKEISSESELLPKEKLNVELPPNNANFHTLAASLAASLPQQLKNESAKQQRERLKGILRFKPLACQAEQIGEKQQVGTLSVKRFRLKLGNDWTLPVVVVTGNSVKETALLLNDAGFASDSNRIAELATAGTQVIAFDPVLIGQAKPDGSLYQNAQLIATVGERPLGVQTSQIISAAAYFADLYSVDRMNLISNGPRMGTAALCAAALDGEQRRFGTLTTENSPDSFKKFLQPAASYDTAPEIYCFGLLKWFDVPQLRELAAH